MADAPPTEEPGPDAPDPEISQPHDKYFRSVFSHLPDAASLLRAVVPQPLADSLQWSTLALHPARFVSRDWRGREADLLFSVEQVEQQADAAPVLLYVLLEHQSAPDGWLRLRLLDYCVQVWVRWTKEHEDDEDDDEAGHRLPLIVPLVFYQGARSWRYDREFAELFGDAAGAWRWVPRFEHLLIDRTRASAETVPGALAARLAQIALMAAFREGLLEQATRLMGELYRAAGFEEVAKHVEYVLATQSEENRQVFAEALQRNVPGRGGELMNYVEQLLEQGRQEGELKGRQEGELKGRQEGELKGRQEGQVMTIEGFLEHDVPWSTIEAATGINEALFRSLKQQLEAPDNGAHQTT